MIRNDAVERFGTGAAATITLSPRACLISVPAGRPFCSAMGLDQAVAPFGD
jgi:hypothetical protein